MEKREAVEKNLVRYNTGRPCIRGHLSDRYTTTGACISCLHPKIHREKATKPESVRRPKRVSAAMVQSKCVPLFLMTDISSMESLRSYIVAVGQREFPGVNELLFWPAKAVRRTCGHEVQVKVFVPMSKAADVKRSYELNRNMQGVKGAHPPPIPSRPNDREFTLEEISR